MTETSSHRGEHHDHHVAEEVLEAVVETALEHADGGDGGHPSPNHARRSPIR